MFGLFPIRDRVQPNCDEPPRNQSTCRPRSSPPCGARDFPAPCSPLFSSSSTPGCPSSPPRTCRYGRDSRSSSCLADICWRQDLIAFGGDFTLVPYGLFPSSVFCPSWRPLSSLARLPSTIFHSARPFFSRLSFLKCTHHLFLQYVPGVRPLPRTDPPSLPGPSKVKHLKHHPSHPHSSQGL